MNRVKIKKYIAQLLFSFLSSVSKLKYRLRLKSLPSEDKIRIAIHFIIEKWSNTASFSLESFAQTSFEKHNIKIFIYCYKIDKDAVSTSIQNVFDKNVTYELIFITEKCQLFELSIKNAICSDDFDIHGFCHAEAIFSREWLDKSISLGLKLTHTKTPFKIAAFSTFNPNDFKLFDTVYQNEDYIIKDGFSFLSIFFFQVFLKSKSKKILKDNNSKHLMEIFKTYEFYAAFTHESFIDGINNESQIEAEKFYLKQNNLSFAQNPIVRNWQTVPKELAKFPYLKLRTLIIQVNYGGLGDHLFCSHLPRIAKEIGRFDKVYISNYSEYRQEATKELVWKLNPFIDGFCDLPGYNIEYLKFESTINILDKIMLLHNLDDRKRFHEPELYFKPIIKPDLKDKIIFDPNYIADSGDNIDNQSIEEYFKSNNIKIDYQMQKRFKCVPINNFSEWLKSNSLEDFFNIIVSCKEIYCFATGTATLASALGKKAHVLHHKNFNKQFLHSKNNTYIEL